MSESGKKRKLLRGAFPKSSQGVKDGQPPTDELNTRKATQFFAVTSHGERSSRFKLMTREGQVYSVPYSLLPVFVLSEGRKLAIITHDIQAVIKGRNLAIIEDYLSKGELLWLKESPSGKDDGMSQVFIEQMDIQLNEDQGI